MDRFNANDSSHETRSTPYDRRIARGVVHTPLNTVVHPYVEHPSMSEHFPLRGRS